MKIRFYVDKKHPGAGELLKVLQGNPIDLKHGIIRVNGSDFGQDSEGIYAESDTFLGGIPSNIAGIPFRLVTIYDEVPLTLLTYAEIARAGLYQLGRATATVDILMRGDYNNWRIRVNAPTFNTAVRLYRKIRSGGIDPVEKWSPEGMVVPKTKAKVGEPTEEEPPCSTQG